MQLIPSEPDIRTVFARIEDKTLDLQPEFQRGEVWGEAKQRLLIDSILRQWYIPPIHVVRVEDGTQVVLDGQQRLRAIVAFMEGRFAVDGSSEPLDPAIVELDGCRFAQLPPATSRLFERFTIRQLELIAYKPEEPSELFFRLNQPATLTAAEKRNALFGHARRQIRDLTLTAVENGMSPDRIGFSGARMAYEDVIARFVWSLHCNNLEEKVTAAKLAVWYREREPIPNIPIDVASESLMRLFSSPSLADPRVRLNKATAHSWLLFIARSILRKIDLSDFDDYLEWFEHERLAVDVVSDADVVDVGLTIFEDRAVARVSDVSSVILRDCVLWSLASKRHLDASPGPQMFLRELGAGGGTRSIEKRLLDCAAVIGWGKLT